jgi:hypothetical protein
MTQVVLVCAAACVVACAVLATAPADFPFLWETKAAALSFGGIGLLLLDPAKAFAVLSAATKL